MINNESKVHAFVFKQDVKLLVNGSMNYVSEWPYDVGIYPLFVDQNGGFITLGPKEVATFKYYIQILTDENCDPIKSEDGFYKVRLARREPPP